MTEREFWTRLEYRLSREFARLPSNELRFLWCDGLEPDVALGSLEGSSWVTGRALISEDDGKSFVAYQFELGPVPPHRSEIDWEALVPGEEVSGWVEVDRTRKELKLLIAPRTPAG